MVSSSQESSPSSSPLESAASTSGDESVETVVRVPYVAPASLPASVSVPSPVSSPSAASTLSISFSKLRKDPQEFSELWFWDDVLDKIQTEDTFRSTACGFSIHLRYPFMEQQDACRLLDEDIALTVRKWKHEYWFEKKARLARQKKRREKELRRSRRKTMHFLYSDPESDEDSTSSSDDESSSDSSSPYESSSSSSKPSPTKARRRRRQRPENDWEGIELYGVQRRIPLPLTFAHQSPRRQAQSWEAVKRRLPHDSDEGCTETSDDESEPGGLVDMESWIRLRSDCLLDESVKDLEEYMNRHPEFQKRCRKKIKIRNLGNPDSWVVPKGLKIPLRFKSLMTALQKLHRQKMNAIRAVGRALEKAERAQKKAMAARRKARRAEGKARRAEKRVRRKKRSAKSKGGAAQVKKAEEKAKKARQLADAKLEARDEAEGESNRSALAVLDSKDECDDTVDKIDNLTKDLSAEKALLEVAEREAVQLAKLREAQAKVLAERFMAERRKLARKEAVEKLRMKRKAEEAAMRAMREAGAASWCVNTQLPTDVSVATWLMNRWNRGKDYVGIAEEIER